VCGIVGVLRRGSLEENLSAVRRGVSRLLHRGPDANGVWGVEGIAFGHARLSVIDLSASANQPMCAPNVPVVITFNGEIYNFRELRAELEALGHTFQTKSDTEVVLASYLAWGEQSFGRLSGMFAVAIWDGRFQRLYIVRDRLGIKPLYYSRWGSSFFFASEPKAILAMARDLDRSLDLQGVHEFIWFGNALGERTLFRNVSRLLPGTYLVVENGRQRNVTYWSVSSVSQNRHGYSVAVKEVLRRLRSSVRSHLVSDVPVGIFLSGGIDSTAITAFAAEQYGPGLRTFSVAFDFEDSNELSYAREAATRFRTKHEEIRVSAPDARELIPVLIRCHDEPFADAANIPLYLLSRQLDRSMKVILQGDGGDEVFGGYHRYEWLRTPMIPWRVLSGMMRTVWPMERNLPRKLQRIGRVVDALAATSEDRYALLLSVETERDTPLQIFSAEFRAQLKRSDPFARYRTVLSKLEHQDPVRKMLNTDLQVLLPDTFLEKVDKATMANGIEVRVPFLSNELVEYAVSLPAEYKVRVGCKKRVLRSALRGIVPDSILDRKKMGFSVPYQRWLRGGLHDFLLTSVRASRAASDGIFDVKAIENCASAHALGRGEYGFLLWKTLNFAIWYDEYRATA
jgi:asparagine synthase (glutamine-hydrolysing)